MDGQEIADNVRAQEIADNVRAWKFQLELQVCDKMSPVIKLGSTLFSLLFCFGYCLLLQHTDFLWIVEPWIVCLNGLSIVAYVLLAIIGTFFATGWANCVERHRKKLLLDRNLHRFFWMGSILCRLWATYDAVLQIDDGLIGEFIQLRPDSREVLPPSSLHMFGVEMKDPQKLDDDVNDAMQLFAPTPCRWGDAVEWIKKGDAVQYAHCIQWLHLLEPWVPNSDQVIHVGELQIKTRQTVWCSSTSRYYGDTVNQHLLQEKRYKVAREYYKAEFAELGIPIPEPEMQQNCNTTNDERVTALFTGAKNFEILPVSVETCKPDTDEKERMGAYDSVCLLAQWAMPHLISRRTLVILLGIVLPQVHPARQLVPQVILCALAIAWRDGASSMELGKYVCAISMLVLWLMITYYIECQEPDDSKWEQITYARVKLHQYQWNDIKHALNLINSDRLNEGLPECKWI